MGRLYRYGNAPSKLTQEQFEDVNSDPKLLALTQERKSRLAAIRSTYGSRRKARSTRLNAEYEESAKQIIRLREKLRCAKLTNVIEDFHARIHREEVAR